jgi:hypothetical protein
MSGPTRCDHAGNVIHIPIEKKHSALFKISSIRFELVQCCTVHENENGIAITHQLYIKNNILDAIYHK